MADFFNKIKTKLFIALCIICVLSFAVFFLTACNSDEDDNVPNYTLTENDYSVISNGSFEFGSSGLEYKDYPKTTSVTGWSTASTDNSSVKSSVNSGIINVNVEAWAELLENLYDDSAFLSYMEDKCGFSVDDLKEDYKTLHPDLSDDEVAEYVRENVIKTYFDDVEDDTVATAIFKNPGTHAGAVGTKIYMLNNYVTDKYGVGTAMKVTSSTTVSLDKGTYGKISVFVNTKNLAYKNNNGKVGANITLSNSFQSANQPVYGIYGIDTGSEWQQYVIYVKADDFYSNSVTVTLGLGYGNGSNIVKDYVEGTVFFDDIVYESVDELPAGINVVDEKTFVYKGEDGIYVDVSAYTYDENNAFVYDMTLDGALDGSTYQKSLDVSSTYATGDFVTLASNGKTTQDLYPASSASITSQDSDKMEVSVQNASYGITIKNDSLFKVASQKYFVLSFYIENNLSIFDANGISVYVYDVTPNSPVDYNDHRDPENITTYKEIGEKTKVTIMIKNTFPSSYTEERPFFVYIVIGAADFKNVAFNDLSRGTVTLSDFNYYTGDINEYDSTHTETENYDYYTLFNSNATGSVTLYSGSSIYSNTNNDSYNLEVANDQKGEIISKITNVKNYVGVESDSIYIDSDSESDDKFDINTRVSKDAQGNYAGLLNSKYVNDDNYTEFDDLKNELDYNGEKNIQAIVINNKVTSSYGFVGNSFTIAASSENSSTYSSIKVKVKVNDDAIANVYLVDCSTASDKSIATLQFVGNIAGYNKDKVYNKKLAFEGITSSMMGADGWLTVTFYISAGADPLNLRLELWNGARDGSTLSTGAVFFTMDAFSEDETFTPSVLTSAFTEPSSIETAFVVSGNPLSDAYALDASIYNSGEDAEGDHWIYYTRELDNREISYNAEQTDSSAKVFYDPTYVWAYNMSKDCTMLYAMYNTIDPVSVDPYANDDDDSGNTGGCAGSTDPASFWMSLSSIILAAVLVFAIIMLIVRKVAGKRKANASDAKSHYRVTSRYQNKSKKEKALKQSYDDYEDENVEKNDTKNVEEELPKETETVSEENTDEYVYGDVQDFGSDIPSDNNSDNSDKE